MTYDFTVEEFIAVLREIAYSHSMGIDTNASATAKILGMDHEKSISIHATIIAEGLLPPFVERTKTEDIITVFGPPGTFTGGR
jgi:hypothetical protein